MWPFKFNLSQQTISENFSNNLLDTLNVSCILCTYKVKILLNLNNPQVTKAYNSRVGTSEAIRLLNINTKISKNRQNKTWNEWLAGLIDGDGSFLLSKKGYASLEITMDIRDEHALQIIKNVYGGSIKLRSGANALRYRLHHKSGLLNLICDVNGHIRNSHRLIQLNKICYKYDLSLIYPEKLLYDSAWFAGFVDADGTITINQTNTQLSISASQKTSEILQPLLELYKGNIYIDRGSSQSFKWYITKREDILKLVEYFKINPLRSAKKNRLHLIQKYYELIDLKADLAPSDSLLAKAFKLFMEKWDKGDYYSIQNSTTISKKEIIQKRNYSTFCKTSPKIISNKLNPWYLTGFSDAEASFTVTFVKNETLKTGYYIQPSFQINLGKNDLALLEKIKSYFKKVGTITKSGSNSFMYRVRSLNDLNNVILPHFTEFPLKTPLAYVRLRA
jgi:hypothetical protein